jgi:hypothetical protein
LAEAELEALRQQLADAPAEVVVANHCYGLFELAAVYLSQSPPRLDGARLAIDALGVLVDGLGDRLGEAHASLREAIAQLRLAYVQIAGAVEHDAEDGPSPSRGAAVDRPAAGDDAGGPQASGSSAAPTERRDDPEDPEA